MKQYTKPTIKEIPIALQQLLCDSPLSINDEEVKDYDGNNKPNFWGTIW